MVLTFAEHMNEYAGKNAAAEGVGDRCQFVEGDFLTYDFKNQKYDVSVAAGVTYYVKEMDVFLKKNGCRFQ